MPRAEITDLFRIDDLLSAEEKAARDAVARFVDAEVLPIIGKHFRDGTFPAHLIPGLAELGVLGANLQGYGCAGMSTVSYGLVLQELERGDSGLRSFASVQGSLCMFPIHAFGSEEQKTRFLPGMAKGQLIGCFGLTEPDFGSNPGGMRARARKDGDSWVLNGTKAWITNGSIADVAVVWAKTDDGGPESVRGFLVEKGMPGFSAREIPGKFSLRASRTSELSFQDVRVPDRNVLPGVVGLRGPLSCLNNARAGIAFAVTGAAIACFEGAREYALSRTQFDGKSIAGYQLTQEKLADMLQEIVKAQLLSLRLARLKDEGKSNPVMVSLAKRNNVKSALDIARVARSIYGANGITDDYPPVRHMLNLESVFTYEGTHEVHTLVLGKAITGIDAFG
ncbi:MULTISPECIES: acyl-CoA dehydrogenase family protein [Corallococcus]|uniref:acyl-CoA dehydrogenase family protein n=1 Tax=Corallococcus TaxID=83461 RepID=UPI000EE38A9F|nr:MULTISPECIES: acyl-CoA dehydrogenase family protein [Corallococcus]NPC74065.1 acyl-CoA dehydrogenase [Corallococcus exiguus]NPD28978.1 acyl-CoA dehydrogenase [Corallococcus exiguus]NRD44261.1 acyl-CoA dehydrogenase family protein [Corallococcus exiguus]RKI04533.1 acyl-CoA dehydrogenase [Corallococcus sp. AB038B]